MKSYYGTVYFSNKMKYSISAESNEEIVAINEMLSQAKRAFPALTVLGFFMDSIVTRHETLLDGPHVTTLHIENPMNTKSKGYVKEVETFINGGEIEPMKKKELNDDCIGKIAILQRGYAAGLAGLIQKNEEGYGTAPYLHQTKSGIWTGIFYEEDIEYTNETKGEN